MLRAAIIALVIAIVPGCGEKTQRPTPVDQTDEPHALKHEDHALTGHEVYQEFCASCHDTGLGNAPVTGNPVDWNDRSQLWMAVLAEHVSAGYLNMPARGGEPELTDLEVSKAVEHMMLTTYPERTRD